MKKIILTIALFAGMGIALNAQNAEGTEPASKKTADKPKTAVEAAKPAAATNAPKVSTAPVEVSKDSTKTSASTEKKCAKKSCCKKGGEESNASHKCGDGKGEAACCKKKAGSATESKKE